MLTNNEIKSSHKIISFDDKSVYYEGGYWMHIREYLLSTTHPEKYGIDVRKDTKQITLFIMPAFDKVVGINSGDIMSGDKNCSFGEFEELDGKTE